MSVTHYGPLTTYEITWMSGHVERIQAHQVTWPGNAAAARSFLSSSQPEPARVVFHAELDGAWTLQLSALEADIRTIRNVATEAVQTSPQAGE